MRIAALVAVSLLIAGCSREVGGDVGQSQTIAPPAPAPSAAPSTPPAAGAPITTIVSWIEAGHPVDPAAYHVATRDGVTTQLGDDVAFSASSGTVACMTDARHTSGTLACLVRLANPPPRPETAYGEWKGGWVDFDGIHLQVGSGPRRPGPVRLRQWTRAGQRGHAVDRGLPLPLLSSGPVLRELRPSVRGPVRQRRDRAVRLPEAGAATRRRGRCVRLLRCTRHKLTRRTRFSD